MKRNYDYLIGKKIEIIEMAGEPHYSGRSGIVQYVDDIGQIHGTWGGLAVVPEEDDFRIIG